MTTVASDPPPSTTERPAPASTAVQVARISWVTVAILAALTALSSALVIGGGAAPLTQDDPGELVRYGIPIARLTLTLSSSAVIGALLIAVVAGRPADQHWNALLDAAATAAGIWTVAAAATTFLRYLALGPPLDSPTFGPNLVLFITTVGSGWLAATIAAALLTTLLIVIRSHTGSAFLLAAAVAALLPIALQGHAASAPGDHGAAIVALALHIAGAAAWLGGLAVVLLLGLNLRGAALADLVSRYSTVALLCFIVVGFSGLVSAIIRLASPAGLLTAYGSLVLLKTLTLLIAGALGALHRWHTIPAIASGRRAPFIRFVTVELLVLAAAAGLAGGLAASPPPEQAVQRPTTPAEILTDLPLPPPMTAATLMTQWRFDPLWILVCGILAVLYVVGVRRLRQRGDAWPVGRTVSWLTGLAVLFWITNGGLNRYQEVLFSAHMLAHMALTMLVPLLLVPAAPVTLALRAIRKRHDGTRGGREWILIGVHSRISTVLTNPLVAAVLFAGSLVVFYFSPVFRWATTDHVGHEWMTAHFLITGYLFVLSMAGADPVPFRFPYPFRLLILLATMAFHAFFGLALILGNGLLLTDWYGAMGWGTSALADQQAGGGVMWSVGEIPTLVLAVIVAVSWARSDDREARRGDRRADRTGDADLHAYNEMLDRLGSRR